MTSVIFKQSDSVQCNNHAYSVFKHKQENDSIFINNMTKVLPHCVRPIDDESKLWAGSQSTRIYTCTQDMMIRGGNAPNIPPPCLKAGYKTWPSRHPNDFLLYPCETNTWRNYIDCDASKCCSIHHQMFDNVTKRK